VTVTITNPAKAKYAKHLYFAPAGHGKTTLLGSAQEDERTYPTAFIDWEAGTESLDGLDIDVFPIRSWSDAYSLLEYFEEGAEVKINGDWIDFAKYNSVGIDSLSEWYRAAQLERLDKMKKQRKEPDLVEYADYNILTTQFRRVLRRFRDLPMHVFFSAHAKQVEDPRRGRITIPDFPGQLAEEVAGLVSVVGYLAETVGDDEAERLLLLHSHPKFRIKARGPWNQEVPEEIEDPDVTEILDVFGYK
jgi:hypothetical protein